MSRSANARGGALTMMRDASADRPEYTGMHAIVRMPLPTSGGT
jgi:hypothetical protein